MHMKRFVNWKEPRTSTKNIIASSQRLKGMNFQRNLNTHKPETMMVFKKAAPRQADWGGTPLLKPHWGRVGTAVSEVLQGTRTQVL